MSTGKRFDPIIEPCSFFSPRKAAPITETIWPIIQNDLNYVGQYWNHTGFDLWEEVDGSSFFTLAAQHRALVEGATFAKSISKDCESCKVAPQLLCFLQTFWNGEYIIANVNTETKRSGKDANTVLSIIQTFDPDAQSCDDNTFQPCSSRALANLKVFVDSFRDLYVINQGTAQGSAVALGRYSEDVYMNGNPWYLCTMAAAEQLYDALYQWDKIGSISIDDTSLAFFKDLDSSAKTGKYDKSSNEYQSLTNAIHQYADGFMKVVQKYTPEDGSLAEQFSRTNGSALSAVDLTWSYAAFMTVNARRDGEVPASWNQDQGSTAPTSCTEDTVKGSYASATVTSLPGGLSTSTPTSNCNVYRITFEVTASVEDGQTLSITGNNAELGNWNPEKSISLSNTKYTADNPVWFAPVHLAPGDEVSYKFIKLGSDGSVTWESDPNRSYKVPSSIDTVKVNWQ